MAVWARINELPIEYYEASVIKQIGQALGKVLRIDTNTAMEARGRYARICVQVDISKSLTTTVRIGQRDQAVIYEVVSKLCFSCGRLGHRKEVCQYTIRQPSSPPKDSFEPNNTDKVVHSPPSSSAHSGDRDKPEPESKEASFGPWMLITRKRKDSRAPKKSDLNPISVLNVQDQNSSKEPLGRDKRGQTVIGPSTSSVAEGKRKAHSELVTSSRSSAHIVEASPFASSTQGLDSLELPGPIGNFHKGFANAKSVAALVKGKKYFARTRASPLSQSSAVSQEKDISSKKIVWSASITKLQTVPPGDFQFCSLARNEVGDQRTGQLQAQQGMEIHAPLEADECRSGISPLHSNGMASDDRSLVDFHGKRTGGGGFEEVDMEILSPALVDPVAKQSRFGDGLDCVQNDGGDGEGDRMESDGGCEVPPSN